MNKDTGDLDSQTYTHLLDTCKQDWFAVLSIIKNTLKRLKSEKPDISKVQLRSDEAGCYHNNYLIVSVRDIAQAIGIEVTGYDFSKLQHGKGICDRILCPMKSSICRYSNEGHDVISAHDMHTVLTQRLVCRTSACVCTIDKTKQTLEVKTIDSFSRYHNFKFEKKRVHLWRAYGIRPGKLIQFKDLISKKTSLTLSEYS